MRWFRKLLALALVVPLQGCLVAADVLTIAQERPSQGLLNEMARMCRADAGVHTFGPPPAGVDLWIPGRSPREPKPGDDLAGIRPVDAWWNSDEPWLRRGFARVIFENIDPVTDWPPTYQGPKRGEPAGVYRFELAPPEDPRCVAYRKVVAEQLKGLRSPPEPADADKRCVVWSYVGPFDGRPRPNMFIRFEDAALRARGIFRTGSVLFVDGSLRARDVSYRAMKPGGSLGTWQTPACEKPSRRLPDGL